MSVIVQIQINQGKPVNYLEISRTGIVTDEMFEYRWKLMDENHKTIQKGWVDHEYSDPVWVLTRKVLEDIK